MVDREQPLTDEGFELCRGSPNGKRSRGAGPADVPADEGDMERLGHHGEVWELRHTRL